MNGGRSKKPVWLRVMTALILHHLLMSFWTFGSRCAVLWFTKGEKYANELLYIPKRRWIPLCLQSRWFNGFLTYFWGLKNIQILCKLVKKSGKIKRFCPCSNNLKFEPSLKKCVKYFRRNNLTQYHGTSSMSFHFVIALYLVTYACIVAPARLPSSISHNIYHKSTLLISLFQHFWIFSF